MIFDKQSILSDAQAITVTAVSTNIIDLGAVGTPINGVAPLSRDLGGGLGVPFRVQVGETFATLTSLKVDLQVSDAADFSSGVETVSTGAAVPAATLVAGYVFPLQYIPRGTNKRYVRMNYTVAGTTATAGNVTAGIVGGNQTNA